MKDEKTYDEVTHSPYPLSSKSFDEERIPKESLEALWERRMSYWNSRKRYLENMSNMKRVVDNLDELMDLTTERYNKLHEKARKAEDA